MAGPPKGNSNATKGKPFAHAIEMALKKRDKTGQHLALMEVANKLIQMALEGDLPSIKELADRTDGKSKQATELSGALELIPHEKWVQMLNDE